MTLVCVASTESRGLLANAHAIDIQGRILFTNDTDYWQAHSFPFIFQNVTTFFKLGGEDVFIYGGKSAPGSASERPLAVPEAGFYGDDARALLTHIPQVAHWTGTDR